MAPEVLPVPSEPPVKFFVNQGVVSSRDDMLNLLRPLLKQTVTYRFLRGRDVAAQGTGWVERIVVDQPDVSTYFTPIAITLNVDSFEHLEFAPVGTELAFDAPFEPQQLAFDTSGYVQMELQGLDSTPAEE